MLGEKTIGIILLIFATANTSARHLGLPQLASSVLFFCVCLRWADCYSSYLASENWNSVLCVNVSLPAFRCVCFLRCQMKMAVLCSFPFFFFFLLFGKDKTLKVMGYSHIIVMEAKEFLWWLFRYWTLLFAWRVPTFHLLPEYKNLSPSCDHFLISINLVRPLEQPLR